ncbi:MAG TPA: multidrug efflux RND transporter permease subunit [Steroidobacteraceae bacterium]|nr:multidrug efflux RND transporter permease subunit [Steroidobacteraceae bacterium]
MPSFFIERPVFAWVIAILLVLFGAIALRSMGVDSYPDIAPPQVTVTANYPGASAATMESTVTQVIEQQLTGIDNLLYFSSTSGSNGQTVITLTFATGTNPDIAAVQVQNKVNLAQPLLPAEVTRQGITVAKASPDILLFIGLESHNPAVDAAQLSDILASQILPEIARVNGVGNTFLLGSEYAVRIWLDPAKLQAYGLSTTQVLNAVQAQNAQFATGAIGADPAIKGQEFTATVSGDKLFTSLREFRNVILRANGNGSVVTLGDIASISFGGQSYGQTAVFNGRPAGGLGVFLSPGVNALAVADAVKTEMASLARTLPPGVEWSVPYDTTPFITASIHEVLITLAEAIALVFLVMLVFLQNLRATLIPTLVIPVALLGTFIGLSVLHFSVNQLTLFGMVLAIGIVVDDAIVVIENVERIMSEEHLDPHAATRKAMKQITGAIVAITVVLTAVFVPSALQPGATGIIYAQFALTIAVSMALSAFLALSFTPALCAALLRPEHHEGRHFLFRWFNRAFNNTAHAYQGHVGSAVRHAPRWMMLFAVVAALAGFLYLRMPTSFVPDEDQGFLLALVNLPPDATLQRTDQVMSQIRSKLLQGPLGKDISGVFQPEGFSFVGTSENVGMVFIKLTDWSKRSQSAMQLIPQVNKLLAPISGAQIFAVNLPTIRGLSRFGGIDLYLLARTGQTHQQLDGAGKTLVADAAKDPMLSQIRENALPSASQLDISVNRKQAASLGLSLSDVYATVDAEIAPLYINQMSYGGRIKRVYIQDEPKYRMNPDALHQLYTPSADLPLNSSRAGAPGSGSQTSTEDMIPLSSVIDAKWSVGPAVLQRYDGYPALEIVGNPGGGFTTGQAMGRVQQIIRKSLPPGYGADWTGQSYQELLSGNSAPALMGLSILVVFLGLAALYESWSVPVAVLLVVPLGLLGMITFCMLTHVPNDIYFKIGLVTVIGLAAKNAILIVEFAVQSQASGTSLFDAVITAARLRLRPILMTSFAFILGVLPLVLSTGAGAVSRHEIGTGVIGGMLFATVFGLLLIPVFYVTVRRVLGDLLHHPAPAAGPESPQ